MKKHTTVEEVIRGVIAQAARYHIDAYGFVLESLEHTYRIVGKKRHVSGPELLDGLRRYAIERYGPMAGTVLAHWGITRCEDVGEIVFNLVDAELLSKSGNDSRDDFRGGYDFKEAFDGIV
ncbi:MAG: hypothetical protein NT045_07110 [Candidatus Aureabacteria bacterium]|nr:hypothetical protein [Candidatus Auribacterota bacterium]